MAQYLISVIHGDDDAMPPGVDPEVMFKAVGVFNDEVQAAGKWVFAGGLFPAATATVVDGTGPEVVTTDGPYVESKEYLGGFWVLEAADLDEALSWAARGSKACMHAVEVRPFQD